MPSAGDRKDGTNVCGFGRRLFGAHGAMNTSAMFMCRPLNVFLLFLAGSRALPHDP
jgi:hypothetical protein